MHQKHLQEIIISIGNMKRFMRFTHHYADRFSFSNLKKLQSRWIFPRIARIMHNPRVSKKKQKIKKEIQKAKNSWRRKTENQSSTSRCQRLLLVNKTNPHWPHAKAGPRQIFQVSRWQMIVVRADAFLRGFSQPRGLARAPQRNEPVAEVYERH